MEPSRERFLIGLNKAINKTATEQLYQNLPSLQETAVVEQLNRAKISTSKTWKDNHESLKPNFADMYTMILTL